MSDFSDLVAQMQGQVVSNLGSPATYLHSSSGVEVSLNAVFSKDHDLYDSDGAIISGHITYIKLQSSDLDEKPRTGDKVTIKSQTYDVSEVRHDGQAGYEVMLNITRNA